MRRLIPLLALALPTSHLAAQTAALAPAARKKIPAIAMLPDGSELQKVMLPRYDQDRNLVSVLKADAMTLVGEGKIAGRSVSIELFNPDQSPRGRIDLARATLDSTNGLVIANEPVEIQSQRLSATGTGLYYAIESGKGFLVGPATTTLFQAPKETTMKSPASPLRAAALGLSLITQPMVASAQAPTPNTQANDAKIARADLRATLKASSEVNQATTEFLDQADLLAPPQSPTKATPPQPLEVSPDALRTVINSQGGTYVDADAGVLAYLKNVTVSDPRFDLSADTDLKVFLEKKAPTPPKPGSKPSALPTPTAGFGEVQRIVATGAVHLRQKNPKPGEPALEARGAIFSYNVVTGEILISGGFPWFSKGQDYFRAKQPNLTLRIDKNFNASTEGDWETGIRLDQKN